MLFTLVKAGPDAKAVLYDFDTHMRDLEANTLKFGEAQLHAGKTDAFMIASDGAAATATLREALMESVAIS